MIGAAVDTDRESIHDWLRLTLAKGIGGETARKLLRAFGLPTAIFDAAPDALRPLLSARQLDALFAPPDPKHLEATLAWLEQPGNTLITLADAGYPRTLLEIPDPPLLLYVKGRSTLLGAPSLAVVGSRNATIQGMQDAEGFALALSLAGYCIVSGLAMGIDSAAHRGGLKGPGSSIAVIGTGADVVYPARNRELAHRLAESGCIVSEYPIGTPALAGNFPRRNRLISGLARGVLVVEAAAQSGSLITARMAAEQGRDVFVIPGSIHAPLSKGGHLLIRQGAKLVESAIDILDELQVGGMPHQAPSSSRQQATIFADATQEANLLSSPLLTAIGFDPVHLDALAIQLGQDVASVCAALLPLEMAGQVEQLPGGQVRRLKLS